MVLLNFCGRVRNDFRMRGLAACAGEGTRCPADRLSLKLNSDAETSIRQPLAIDHASQSSQVADKRADHEPFIQFFSLLRQDAHSKGANVFSGCPLRRRGVIKARNLHGEGQLYAFFKSTRPHRHVCLALSIGSRPFHKAGDWMDFVKTSCATKTNFESRLPRY